MKKLLVILALAMLMLCVPALAEGLLGAPLDDFTVATIDGDTFTLSEALRDHDMVLINLWATWCGPCEMEFPYMEQAYEQYSDRVAIVALSIEPTDTPEKLRDFAETHGMTFAVGNDAETGLANTFSVMYIPTSVVVDRFGNVALIESGTQTSAGSFTALFDYFLSEDYTETTVLDGFPAPKPVAFADAASLAAGGALVFENPEDDNLWPMLPAEDDGRAALQSSNAGVGDSIAVVYATVNAQAGDALAFDFKTSLQPAFDALFVSIDDEIVKRFTGEHDWTAWAIPLPEGEHEIAFGCEKDPSGDGIEDRVWVSNARVEGGAALPPEPPVDDAFSVSVNDTESRRVAFDDPDGMMAYYFGTGEGWITGGSATIDITISPAEDPETAAISDATGVYTVASALKPDNSGYAFDAAVDQPDGYAAVAVYPGVTEAQLEQGQTVLLFDGEAGADAFVDYLANYGIDVSWQYVEAATPAESLSAYQVTVTDQNGDPVPGATLLFCTDTACTPVEGDDNGVVTFDGAPDTYHLQILELPEGYSFDEDFEAYTEPFYSAMTITVNRDL